MIKVTGDVVVRRNGTIVYSGKNILTHVGLEEFAKLIIGGAGVSPSHIACGDDGTAPAQEQTDLIGTEILRVAAPGTANGPAGTLVGTFTGWGTAGTIREFGIFNAAVGGVMIARLITAEIDFIPTDELTVEWTFTFLWESTPNLTEL